MFVPGDCRSVLEVETSGRLSLPAAETTTAEVTMTTCNLATWLYYRKHLLPLPIDLSTHLSVCASIHPATVFSKETEEETQIRAKTRTNWTGALGDVGLSLSHTNATRLATHSNRHRNRNPLIQITATQQNPASDTKTQHNNSTQTSKWLGKIDITSQFYGEPGGSKFPSMLLIWQISAFDCVYFYYNEIYFHLHDFCLTSF